MSTYQLFVTFHALKEVLIWLVPLVVAVLLCVTALVISSRWMRERKERSDGLSGLLVRVETIESRIAALESAHTGVEGKGGPVPRPKTD